MIKRIKIILLSALVCLGIASCHDNVERHNFWSKENAPDTLYRNLPVAFTIGGNIYLGLGFGDKLRKDWWQYAPSTNTWVKKADFPGTLRVNEFYTSDDTYGYMGLGYTTDFSNSPFTLTNDIWQYDPLKDTWTMLTTAPFTVNYNFSISFAMDNKLFVTHDKELWAFDLSSKSWLRKNDIPFTESSSSSLLFSQSKKALIISGDVYVIFNELTDPQAGYPYTSIWKYNSANDLWSPVKTGIYTGNVFCASTFAVSGVIYMTTDLNIWFSVNVLENNSEPKHYLPNLKMTKGASNAASCVENNRGYVYLNYGELWQYTP